MKLNDDEIVHVTAAQQWLARAEQARDEGHLKPGISQAYVVITHLLRMILTHECNCGSSGTQSMRPKEV